MSLVSDPYMDGLFTINYVNLSQIETQPGTGKYFQAILSVIKA